MTPKEKSSNLTAEWLRDNMHYDPATGSFHWKKPGFGRTVGKPIGSKLWTKGKSYLTMKVDGTVYYAHRIAWLYHYGEWPAGSVDHIDEDRANNAIANLRLATPAQNAARRTTNRSIAPSRGVFPHGTGFVARIHHGGKRHYLGYFSNAANAQAAYEAKAIEIHGEFAFPKEERRDRENFENFKHCEICGTDKDLRLDRTPLGNPRGKLCVNCWGLVLTYETPANLMRTAHKAVEYMRSVEAWDDVAPQLEAT